MPKIIFTIVAMAAFGGIAHASPATGSHQAEAAQPRKYWLSEDLNRLVFWETPTQRDTQSRPETDRSRVSH